MGVQRGKNRAGLSGTVVDQTSDNATQRAALLAAGTKFIGECVTWAFRRTADARPRRGTTLNEATSTGNYLDYRDRFESGGIVLYLDKPEADWPESSTMRGQRGSLILTIHTGRKITVPVLITEADWKIDPKHTDDVAKPTITAVTTGAAVFAGWPGTQQTAGTPTRTDIMMFDGTNFAIDANVLASNGQIVIDWWDSGVAVTHAGLITKLASVIALVSVPSPLKKTVPRIGRDHPDGGEIVIPLSLTDTADDFKFPRSPQMNDVSDLEDTEAVAAIETADSHIPPTPPTGLKLIETSKIKINDQRWGFVDYFGRRTREEAIEMDGSPKTIDASSISDAYSVTSIEANSTVSPPSATTGYVYRQALILQRHAASTGEKWIHRYDYTRVTHAKEIEFAGMTLHMALEADTTAGRNIGQVSALRVVSNDDDPPDVQPVPSDYGITGKVVGSRSQRLTTDQGSYSGYWQHDYIIAANSAYDEIINRGIYTIDPTDIGTDQVVWETNTSSTYPTTPTAANTDLQLVSKTRQRVQVSPERWQFSYRFARNTKENELEHTSRLVDASLLVDTETHPILHNSGTAVGSITPTAVNTLLVLRDTKIDRLCFPNGTFTGLFLWTFEFGRRTHAQDITFPGTVTTTDQSGNIVGGSARVTVIEADGTSDGATVSGMVLREIEKEQIYDASGAAKWKHTYIFGQSTREDEIELDGTDIDIDPSDLASTARVTLLSNNGTYPGALDTAPTVGSVLLLQRSVKSQRINTTAATWKHTATYGLTTVQEDEERGGTKASADWMGENDRTTTTISDIASTLSAAGHADALFLANMSDSTLMSVEVQKLTSTRAKEILKRGGGDKSWINASNHVVREAVRGVPKSGRVELPSGQVIKQPGNVIVNDGWAWVLVAYNGLTLRARPTYIWRALGRFTYRRIFAVNAAVGDDYLTFISSKQKLAVRGCINTAPFLGYLAGEVMYVGPAVTYTFTLSDTHRLMIDYQFATDNWKHFNDGNLPEGYTFAAPGVTISASGFVLSNYLETGYVCEWPSVEVFSGFTD